MVRAKRTGAKEQLASALEENARLRAAMANPDLVVQQLMDQAPAGITIIGKEPLAPVTGGMTRKQQAQEAFGKRWWCKVTELALPNARDIQQVATLCRAGENIQVFQARVPVLLPESEIQKLENDCVVVSRIPVKVGARDMTEQALRDMNPDMDLEIDSQGRRWLVSTQARFAVQRLRPEQESLTIS